MVILDSKKDKIKVKWVECVKSNSELFTEGIMYGITDRTMLDKKCSKTNVHKIYANTHHWYEFSDSYLDGIGEDKEIINILGSDFKWCDRGVETIGTGKIVNYHDLR